jgi:hypothetical protein
VKAAAKRVIEKTRQDWEPEMTILTNEQLVQLTGGLVQGAAQRRWIAKQLGFNPPVKIDGHPMVTWEQVNRGPTAAEKRASGPRWSIAA